MSHTRVINGERNDDGTVCGVNIPFWKIFFAGKNVERIILCREYYFMEALVLIFFIIELMTMFEFEGKKMEISL